MPSPLSLIAKANEMTRTAKASWFGLISYLAFIGVTLMGVRDEDFFLVEKETPLPLIGVSIPTFLFFYVAPVLGAALFAYFHLHLMKLWEVLADALDGTEIRPLSDHLAPWLVVDFALAHRPGALRVRPARWLAWLVTMALVYIATPLVLGFFWWRSMPAHEPWLTMAACGGSLLVVLYLALTSWRRMYWLIRLQRRMEKRWRWDGAAVFALLITAVSAIGWFRTGEPLETYVPGVLPALTAGAERETPFETWLRRTRNPDSPPTFFVSRKTPLHALVSLSSADLAGVDFSYAGDDFEDFEPARDSERMAFCARNEIPSNLCLSLDTTAAGLPPSVVQRRAVFCAEALALIDDKPACNAFFAEKSAAFAKEWPALWTKRLQALPARDLNARDFRDADLQQAKMQRADLGGAQMQGADLRDAQMQGADLGRAQMQGADLRDAQMQGADLGRAQMQGADLWQAQMQGADLRDAQMQGADLGRAQMQGADLRDAQMQGADLGRAQMQGADLRDAQMQGADLGRAQMQGADLWQAQMQGADLWQAQMQGAILWDAQMQGADLWQAQMQGAILWDAQMNSSTDLTAATFQGAAVKSVDDITIAQLRPFWQDIFADGSVQLPQGEARPDHWSEKPLEFSFDVEDGKAVETGPFIDEWRAWQRSIGFDPDTPQ